MASLKVFTKKDCPNCPDAKKLVSALKGDGCDIVEEYDVDTSDGLAEGAFYEVMSTPTMLLVDSDDAEIMGWRGSVPSLEEVKREMASHLG